MHFKFYFLCFIFTAFLGPYNAQNRITGLNDTTFYNFILPVKAQKNALFVADILF